MSPGALSALDFADQLQTDREHDQRDHKRFDGRPRRPGVVNQPGDVGVSGRRRTNRLDQKQQAHDEEKREELFEPSFHMFYFPAELGRCICTDFNRLPQSGNSSSPH
jgi:hypothetical protein